MWLALKLTAYCNATTLKPERFHTITTGHSLEFWNGHNPQTDERPINHPLSKPARFPSGLWVISLPFVPL